MGDFLLYVLLYYKDEKMFLDKEIKASIDRHKIISFDIFGTLLLRPYAKPTDLFFHLEKIEEIEGFATERINAEQRARKLHTDVEDITIDEIYAEIADKYKNLKQKEMDLECQVLQPNPEIKEIFEYAKEQKKQIIVISDMYLPENFLSGVLKKKGYIGIKKIYVSGKYGKCKDSGNLYKKVLSELCLDSREVLHIGDNKFADKIIAEKEGISAVLYPKAIDRLLTKNVRAKKFYEKYPNNLVASIILGMLTLTNKSENYWQDFGYKYAGPVIFGFMQWLEQQLKKDKISEVMFVARDGYTLEKVFNLINDKDFRTHYFYAPRSVNLAVNLNYELNCKLGEKQGLTGLRSLLNYYKQKEEFLHNNIPQINTSAEGVAFIKENKDLFDKLAEKEKKAYAGYLEQFNIKDKKIALVDSCSLLLSAQKTLSSVLSDKKIKGYYFFTWENSQKDFDGYETTAYESSHIDKFVDWNIMELFMTAPTPPAERIEKGKVVFKKISQHEAKRIEIYPDLSQGAIDFAQKYLEVFGKYNINFICENLIDWVNILCLIPTENDKKHFIDLYHAGDQEHTDWIPLPLTWFNKNIDFYLLGLPLLRIQKKPYKWICKLFCYIPLFGYKNKAGSECFYLFGAPLFQIKTKGKIKKLLLFKAVPIISVEKEKYKV